MVRRVRESDISEILGLYRLIFDLDMSRETYRYWYYDEKEQAFCSFVYENKGKIVGHNAAIKNGYIYRGDPITVGLLSGGMSLPESPGAFFQVTKKIIGDFEGDLLISFPNRNAVDFFKRLYNFHSIPDTYYTLGPEGIISNAAVPSRLRRTDEHIAWRIDRHTVYDYRSHSHDSGRIIYKIYKENELDIVYSSNFGDEFIHFVREKWRKYDKINIVHWDETFMREIGFKKSPEYNEFVFKNFGENTIHFEFQMLDSDVF